MLNKIIDKYLSERQIICSTEFIPVSKCPLGLTSRINWKAELIRNHTKQAFCFWQSLTKLNKVDSPQTGDQYDLIRLAIEHELQVLRFGSSGIHSVKRLKQPQAIDILKQLFSNIKVLESQSYEAWVKKNNLDPMDLRNKGQYWTNVMNALKLKTIFSSEEQEELKNIINNLN